MDKFEKVTQGFNFVYEKALAANETVILEMPAVSHNKRSINDIGWQSDGNVKLYGTLSKNPESESALWQEIDAGDEINKTVSALKILCGDLACNIVVRVIMC
ncbi:MAG: hypothetical protein IKK94_03870 [Clostridia bacterium]|nr:hypothetical protein [Clostridia bacterium]